MEEKLLGKRHISWGRRITVGPAPIQCPSSSAAIMVHTHTADEIVLDLRQTFWR